MIAGRLNLKHTYLNVLTTLTLIPNHTCEAVPSLCCDHVFLRVVGGNGRR